MARQPELDQLVSGRHQILARWQVPPTQKEQVGVSTRKLFNRLLQRAFKATWPASITLNHDLDPSPILRGYALEAFSEAAHSRRAPIEKVHSLLGCVLHLARSDAISAGEAKRLNLEPSSAKRSKRVEGLHGVCSMGFVQRYATLRHEVTHKRLDQCSEHSPSQLLANHRGNHAIVIAVTIQQRAVCIHRGPCCEGPCQVTLYVDQCFQNGFASLSRETLHQPFQCTIRELRMTELVVVQPAKHFPKKRIATALPQITRFDRATGLRETAFEHQGTCERPNSSLQRRQSCSQIGWSQLDRSATREPISDPGMLDFVERSLLRLHHQ